MERNISRRLFIQKSVTAGIGLAAMKEQLSLFNQLVANTKKA